MRNPILNEFSFRPSGASKAGSVVAQLSDVALERLMKYEQMAADAHRRAATAENMEDRAYYIEVAMEWEGLAARLKEAAERGVQDPNARAPERASRMFTPHH